MKKKNRRQIVFWFVNIKLGLWNLYRKKMKKVCFQATAYEFYLYLENPMVFFIHKTRSTRIFNNLQYIPIVILQITINKYNRLINSFWTKNWFIKILDLRKVSNAFVTRIRPLEFNFEIEPNGHLIYELIFHLGISRDSLFPRAPRKFY